MILSPYCSATTGYIPFQDDWQDCEPIWWHTLASDWNADAGTTIDGGRFVEATGSVEGAVQPTPEDTYLSGTAGRTGRAFTAVSGAWKDDWVAPWSDRYGLLMADNTAGQTFELVEAAPYSTSGLTNSLVVIRRGMAPAGSAGAHSAGGMFAYLELAYGQAPNYRIALRWGAPIALEVTTDGATWSACAVARQGGNLENFLAANDDTLRIHIRPNNQSGVLVVEIEGIDDPLRAAAQRPVSPFSPQQYGLLPQTEQMHLYGQNGWISLEVYPCQFESPTVTKSPMYFGWDRLKNAANGTFGQLLGSPEPGQAGALAPTFDGMGGMGWQLKAASGTAAQPARVDDVVMFVPAIWTPVAPVGVPLPAARLPVVHYREVQTWNDATRTGETQGRLTIGNRTGNFTGSFGQYAVNILAGNGVATAQRLRGVLGADPDGITLTRHDPARYVDVRVEDFWSKLHRPLNQEVILDGLCIYTAVNLLLEIGQISPKYRVFLPNPDFPPYGPGFPYYILGKGTGLAPIYRFTPERTVASVLMELVQDSGDPYTGAPHFMWFDAYGNFHWEAYNPFYWPLKKTYTSLDRTGLGQILDIQVFNSVDQLATDVTIQGQDAITYELMQYNFTLPWNYFRIGYRKPAFERNARYATPAYMQRIARVAAVQASLPTQVVRMKVPYDPNVYAGDVIAISEEIALGRTGVFNILEIDSTVGFPDPLNPAQAECYSWITARSVENSIPVS